jgi:hypothetical protein
MNINITKKEYRLLLDMLYIADWVLDALSEQGQSHYEHQALKTRLLSLSKEMDAEDCIEYSKELNEHFETKDYEDAMQERYIEPYEEMIFWDQLIYRLAVRDLIQEIGITSYKKMKFIERATKIEQIKKKYAKEFDKNEVKNIAIL